MQVNSRSNRSGFAVAARLFLAALPVFLSGCSAEEVNSGSRPTTQVNAIDKPEKAEFTYDATNGTKSGTGVFRTNGKRDTSERRSAAPEAATKTEDKVLTQPMVALSGMVRFEDGKPVTTGTVRLISYVQIGGEFDKRESEPTQIGSDGSYSIQAPDARHINMVVEGDFPRTYESLSSNATPKLPKLRKVKKDIEVVRGVEIAGRVVDEKDQPVADASVSIQVQTESGRGFGAADGETSSTATGEFTFKFARPGNAVVIATHPDLASGRAETGVPTTGPLIVKMLRGGATVTGRVFRQETGEPQPGVTVSVMDQGTWQSKTAETQGDGSFTVNHITPGRNRISLKTNDPALGGFPAPESPLNEMFSMADGETTDVTLFVYGGHTITGKVFDRETATPLPGALVTSADKRTTAIAGADGVYNLEHVFAGSGNEQLMASLDGYMLASEERHQQGRIYVQLKPDELVANRDIPMAKTVTVSGVVKTAEGVPVPGAAVQLKAANMGSPQEEDVRFTQADGTYKLEVRPFYDAVVKAEAEGYAIAYSEAFHVDNRDLENIDITMDVGATVQGTVVDPDGKPVPSANVSASTMVWVGNYGIGDSIESDTTNEEGSFLLSNLPKTTRLSASHDEYASAETEELALTPGESRGGIVLQLKTGYSIKGKVVDQSDVGVEGMHVYTSGGAHSSDQTDKTGAFELKKLPEGSYRVYASGGAGSANAENVKTGTSDLVLKVGSREAERDRSQLIGTVIDSATKEPIAKFTIKNLGSKTRLDPQRPGGFTAEGLQQGVHYTAEISADGYVKARIEVPVPRGKSSFEQTFELGKGGAITGTVVEAGTLKPLEGVLVVNWGGSTDEYQRQGMMPEGSSTTDADGKFTLAPAPGGDNLVIVRPQAPLTEASRTVKVVNDQVTDAGTIEVGRGGVIFGTITSGLAQDPVSQATVTVHGWAQNGSTVRKTDTTDHDGAYRFEALPPRNYSVSVSRYSVQKGAELKAGEEKQVDINLGGTRVFGIVTRGGQPVRCSVSARKTDSGTNASASAENGSYELTGLSPGEWKFSIYQHDSNTGRSHEETVMIPDTEDHEQNFALPDITITGVVLDAAGEPVPGASVSLSQKQTSAGGGDGWRGGFNASDSSDYSGRFSFTGMTEGTYQVSARKEGVGVGMVPAVQARDGAPADVQVHLKTDGGTLVSVALNMADGSGLQAAWCYLYGENGRLSHDAVRGADGVMRITNIPPGNYRVNVSAWSYSQSERNVEIKAGETVTIEDVLYAAGALEWTLTKADGTAANATATVTPLDGASIENPKTGTAVGGKITVRGLAPGNYQAVAQAEGKAPVTETFAVVAGDIARKQTTVAW